MRDYKRCFCALVLLATVSGCGRGVDPSVVDPYDVLHESCRRSSVSIGTMCRWRRRYGK